MAIKLAVIGAFGRMGKAICRLALKDSTFELCGLIDALDQSKGQTYEQVTGLKTGDLMVVSDFDELKIQPEAIIDFSFHKATMLHLEKVAKKKKKIPYVIGTTGFSGDEVKTIKKYSKVMPLLLSPNMSLGVNILFLLTEVLTKSLGKSYDIEIIEGHHNQKADSPSGTALKILEVIKNNLNDDEYFTVNGRNGLVGKRKPKEIGMHAIRGGSIIGEHCVFFAGTDDEIRIEHRALNRDIFAKGALKCAEFLHKKTPGFYDMKAVLGLA